MKRKFLSVLLLIPFLAACGEEGISYPSVAVKPSVKSVSHKVTKSEFEDKLNSYKNATEPLNDLLAVDSETHEVTLTKSGTLTHTASNDTAFRAQDLKQGHNAVTSSSSLTSASIDFDVTGDKVGFHTTLKEKFSYESDFPAISLALFTDFTKQEGEDIEETGNEYMYVEGGKQYELDAEAQTYTGVAFSGDVPYASIYGGTMVGTFQVLDALVFTGVYGTIDALALANNSEPTYYIDGNMISAKLSYNTSIVTDILNVKTETTSNGFIQVQYDPVAFHLAVISETYTKVHVTTSTKETIFEAQSKTYAGLGFKAGKVKVNIPSKDGYSEATVNQ